MHTLQTIRYSSLHHYERRCPSDITLPTKRKRHGCHDGANRPAKTDLIEVLQSRMDDALSRVLEMEEMMDASRVSRRAVHEIKRLLGLLPFDEPAEEVNIRNIDSDLALGTDGNRRIEKARSLDELDASDDASQD